MLFYGRSVLTPTLTPSSLDTVVYHPPVPGVTLCTLGESLGCSVPEAVHTSAMERCIRRQFLCDGHNDCYNGDFLSDEFGCGEYRII